MRFYLCWFQMICIFTLHCSVWRFFLLPLLLISLLIGNNDVFSPHAFVILSSFVSLFSFPRVFLYTSLIRTKSMCWMLDIHYVHWKLFWCVLCKHNMCVSVCVRALVSCMYLPLDTKLLQTSLVAWKLTEMNRRSGRRKQVCSSNHLLYHCECVWVYLCLAFSLCVSNVYVFNFSVSAFACSTQSFSIWPIRNTNTCKHLLYNTTNIIQMYRKKFSMSLHQL